jgi:hypothetical protein
MSPKLEKLIHKVKWLLLATFIIRCLITLNELKQEITVY